MKINEPLSYDDVTKKLHDVERELESIRQQYSALHCDHSLLIEKYQKLQSKFQLNNDQDLSAQRFEDPVILRKETFPKRVDFPKIINKNEKQQTSDCEKTRQLQEIIDVSKNLEKNLKAEKQFQNQERNLYFDLQKHKHYEWLSTPNKHPETKLDEKFLTNANEKSFNSLGWRTKRRGQIAYFINGKPLSEILSDGTQYFPVFVQIQEILADNDKQLQQDWNNFMHLFQMK